MGIEEKGQICVMIHSGSRGFGHQVATGYKLYVFLFLYLLFFSFISRLLCYMMYLYNKMTFQMHLCKWKKL